MELPKQLLDSQDLLSRFFLFNLECSKKWPKKTHGQGQWLSTKSPPRGLVDVFADVVIGSHTDAFCKKWHKAW